MLSLKKLFLTRAELKMLKAHHQKKQMKAIKKVQQKHQTKINHYNQLIYS